MTGLPGFPGSRYSLTTQTQMGRPTHEAPTREYTHKHTLQTQTQTQTQSAARQSRSRTKQRAAWYMVHDTVGSLNQQYLEIEYHSFWYSKSLYLSPNEKKQFYNKQKAKKNKKREVANEALGHVQTALLPRPGTRATRSSSVSEESDLNLAISRDRARATRRDERAAQSLRGRPQARCQWPH